jgi:ankyrin repeat protein
MAWGINKEYHSCVKELIQIAETKKPDVAKLIYLEVLEDVNHVQDQAGFSGLKAMILQKLVHIYRHQRNLPAVERISKQLSENISRSPEFDWAQVINSLAQCFMETSAEISTVFDDIDMCIEPPLCGPPNGLFPPLHRALRSGLDEVARVLCKSTEALNAVDMLRQNVVIAAAATGKVALLESVIYEMPKLLADRDLLARTALFHAAQQGDFDSFSYLVSAGANIHDSDSSGVRILDAAAASGSSIIVRCLLQLGVPPNDGTLCLPSALHEAARSGHKDICIALLSHGAWANIRSPEDGHFKTPSQVALDHGFVAVAALLEEAEQHPKNDFFYQNSDQSNNKQFRAARHKAASTSNATSMDMAPSWLSERSLMSSPGVLTPDTFRPSISEGSTPNDYNEMINVETCSPFGSILGTDRAISEPATEAEPLVECKHEVIDLTV